MRLLPKPPSIRWRLAIVYALGVVATCAVLIALNYALLYRSMYTNIKAPSPEEMAAMGAQEEVDPQTGEKILSYQNDQATIARLRAHTLGSAAGTSTIVLAGTALLGLGISWF